MMILCLSDVFFDSATKERTIFFVFAWSVMKFFSFATIVLYILYAFELINTYKLYNIYRAYVFVSPKVIKMLIFAENGVHSGWGVWEAQ